jgi:PAS domain S-box-containing protein
MLEIFQDITDRKLVEFELIGAKERAEESNIRFQALHRASFGGISIHDKGIILDCNQGLAEMTGYSLDELIGMNGLLLISEKSRDLVLNNILTGYEKPYEAIGLRKNGEEFPMRLEARTIPYKGKNVRTVEFRDITEQKHTENELILAKESAEESERLKLAFLANMSHEIRTPMNGILGFMDLLLESELDSDQRDQYIKIVKSSGNRLLDTINDIIDISKIESGQSRINSADFDINTLIHHLYGFFLPEAREKDLTFSILEQLPAQNSRVKTDGNKVESVLTNLIKNALKFTRKGSIGIGCRLADNMLEFFVTDTGMGILPQQLSKIFDRFVQADTSLSRPYEGSGLGLSIARAYVEMLGGSIRVESTPGSGSTFSFNIPWIPVDAKPLIPEQKTAAQLLLNIEAVILIAEDDNISYAYLSKILQSERIELIKAVNGLEAVKHCHDRPDISLILMDIKMPEMDGYEATRQILTFRPGLPIVALTAYAFAEDRENARKSGCVDYLSKPLNKAALMKVLTAYLNKGGR